MRVRPLHYAAGADATLDRPPHVRAWSGVAWLGDRLVVVQDDANFVALVDPETGEVVAIPLAAGIDGRRTFGDASGNKAHKLDLEGVVSIPLAAGGTRVVALGSGSTGRREVVVTLDVAGRASAAGGLVVTQRQTPRFYARLRDEGDFAGSELNVEGVVYLHDGTGGRLRLFNRGNGAPRASLVPVNATCDVSWAAFAAYLDGGEECVPPTLGAVTQYDLGAIGGLPLTFTDASLVRDADARRGCCIAYTAAAEASPDATRDGPVAGCAIGVIEEGGAGTIARWTTLCAPSGEPFDGKVEGIALHPDNPTRAFVVVDRDAPETPSELCEVALHGAWFDGA